MILLNIILNLRDVILKLLSMVYNDARNSTIMGTFAIKTGSGG